MIKVENHEVTMFGELEELSAEITLLMATRLSGNGEALGRGKGKSVARFNGKICSKP